MSDEVFVLRDCLSNLIKGIGKCLVKIFSGIAVIGFPASTLIGVTTLQEGGFASVRFDSTAVCPEESEFKVYSSLLFHQGKWYDHPEQPAA